MIDYDHITDAVVVGIWLLTILSILPSIVSSLVNKKLSSVVLLDYEQCIAIVIINLYA